MKTENEELVNGVQCRYCDQMVEEDDTTQVLDFPSRSRYITVCNTCLEQHYILCNNCEKEYVDADESDAVIDGDENTVVCSHCIIHYEECADCGNRVHTNNTVSDSYTTVCSPCFEQSYQFCDNCEDIINNNDIYTTENDEALCSNCYRDSYECVYDSCHKPHWVEHKCNDENDNHTILLGVETEMECGDNIKYCVDALKPLSKNEQLFFLKYDGSISNGFELVTHPMTLKYHTEQFDWSTILKTCTKHSMVSDTEDNCGVHIHINKSVFSIGQQIRLGLFIHVNRSFVEKIARRPTNGYATYYESINVVSARQEVTRPSNRYSAINFRPDETIEFRVFQGTTKRKIMLSYLQFVHALGSFVKETNFFTATYLTDRPQRSFIDYIKKNREQYPELVDRVQIMEMTYI